MIRRMIRNLGPLERSVRLLAGIGLLGLYGALDPPWRYGTLFGLVLIATAWTGWCPVYQCLRRPDGAPQSGG